MRDKRQRNNEKPNESVESQELTWEGADLPRVAPGDYKAVCIGWQGPEWVLAFQRWSLRLEFSLLADGTAVSAFFNLGSERKIKAPGRRSRFYSVWSQANGEPPRKGQKITLETFTEAGLLYTVRVDDAIKDEKQADKPEALVYSKITDVLKIERK
jgi:hypothetical protein